MTPEERLEWQAELDSAMSDIDSRLRHPRRRAGDQHPQPLLPELGQVDLTSELLDEIAWRVAEQMRRRQAVPVESAPAPQRSAAAPRPPAPVESGLRHGKIVAIRFRWPLFRFRLFRRRKHLHPLSTLNISAK